MVVLNLDRCTVPKSVMSLRRACRRMRHKRRHRPYFIQPPTGLLELCCESWSGSRHAQSCIPVTASILVVLSVLGVSVLADG